MSTRARAPVGRAPWLALALVLALPLAVAAAGPASGLATAGTSAGQSPAGHAAAVRSSDTLPSAVRSSAGRASAWTILTSTPAASAAFFTRPRVCIDWTNGTPQRSLATAPTWPDSQ